MAPFSLTSFRFALVVALIAAGGCSSGPGPRRIAVTLDDAPLVKPLSYANNWERESTVDSLISTLSSRHVPSTVFVIGSDLQDATSSALLRRWTDSGARVANHSLTHRSFKELPRAEGVREMAQAQALLSRIADPESIERYFRFPFLEEGRTLSDRDDWMLVLDSLALSPARVSIVTDDWRFDNRYASAEASADWELRYEIGQQYMEHVKNAINHWDGVARTLFGRNVQHVLMLHANRINRDYLGQILDLLASEGFEFIPLEQAYQDPLYRESTSWMGPSGVSVLETIKQSRMDS
jgi:peptidoglycan/xylan/chitin deacetylase (PgdA/CDA1 family)